MTKFFHDQCIHGKSFVPGQKILLYNSQLHIFAGKLKTRWSRPFNVCTVFPHAVVIFDPKSGEKFKVNEQRLKSFLTTKLESQAENMLGLFDPSYT